jgi:hypothetical protein
MFIQAKHLDCRKSSRIVQGSLYFYIFYALFANNLIICREPLESKVIIAGIAKDTAFAVENTIKNIEKLGSHFKEYAVIIYENNSGDATPILYKEWALRNLCVDFTSEILSEVQSGGARTEKIARARNKVLDRARTDKYSDFDYFIFADLDFTCPWPIQAILDTIAAPYEWDCVSANGVRFSGAYWDRLAYRGMDYPLGPELLLNEFWDPLFANDDSWFVLNSPEWKPVYSAFGGLAIYKMKSIIPFTYSGVVTEDLELYYKRIISNLSFDNQQLKRYLNLNDIQQEVSSTEIPIVFRTVWYDYVVCCEHVTLHASMALNGFGKFYINPHLYLTYY